MDHFIVFAIVIFLSTSIVKTQTKYRLYMEPSTILGPFTTEDQFNINAIIPENHDLMILYTLQNTNRFVASIHSYSNGYLQTQDYDQFFRFQIGFVNAFWVKGQFLLVVWKSLTIIYRPPFYGWKSKNVKLEYNSTILQSTVVKSEDKQYLIVIEDGNQSWIMKRYQLQTDYQVFLKLINQTQFRKTYFKEDAIRLIRTKHFTCILIRNFQDQEYRIYGINFDNNATVNFSIKTNILVRQGDLKTDDIFVFDFAGNILMKYSISQNGIDIQKTIVYEADPEDNLNNLKIVKNEIFLVFTSYDDHGSMYIQILQQDDSRNYSPTQFLTFDQIYDTLLFAGKKDNELTLIGFDQDDKKFGIVYTKYISEQSNTTWSIIIYILLLMMLFYTACHSFLHFKVLRQLFLFERMYLSLFTEITLVTLIHAGILLLTLQTDTSSNGNFKYNPERSVSPQSFELRMFQMIFCFTALTSVLLESSAEFKAKNTYLGFLFKHGLKTNFYFNYKQQLLLIRAIAYGLASTAMFSFLESRCNPQLRLYPSMEQLALIAASYALCLYTLHNLAYILAYLCRTYWHFVQWLLSIIFFFSFVTDQFYLNRVVTFEEKASACLSPIALLSSVTQQIFKTQIRFNNKDISSTFLFFILILQSLVGFLVFRVIFTRYFNAISLEVIMNISSNKENGAINQSTESESLDSNTGDTGDRALLRVFIPCKLSTNEGFEKMNVLRNIRFSGNRGEILTFLDCQNLSKRTLFEILVNEQQSDKQVERDLVGRVSFSEHVKVSIVLDDSPFFGDLTVIERLQLVSRLREPSISIKQQMKNIDFILNEFNIPQEFRTMKSCDLSGGYLKKAALACAFIGSPDVVIIDQPTLGLDIRFRNIFHKKLRQWKHGMLIIIGTSDQAEADAVSDRIWIIQNGKAIDRSVEKYRRLMTQLKICFCKQSDYKTISKVVGNFFKDKKAAIQEECNESKSNYKISISVFSECMPSKQLFRRFMRQINETLPLNGDQCFINFSIVEHPYDEFSFTPFKAEPFSYLNELTCKDIQLYQMNKVFDEESDDQLIDKSETVQSKVKESKVTKLINLLKKQEEYQSINWAQAKGILYLHTSLWKGGQLQSQLLTVSIFSWAHCIFLFKMKRPLECYDYVYSLITYCLLHLSLVDLRTNQDLLMTEVSPRIYVTAKWIYDFAYLFAGFSLNTFLQAIIIEAIILDRSEFNILEKLLCSVLFIACYTIFTPNLAKIVRQRRYVIVILLLTHICLIQANFNSFVDAYSTSDVTVSEILQYFFYPLTTMALYNSLVSHQQCWVFIVSMLLQMIMLYLVLNLLQNQQKGPQKHLSKEYRHVLSQTINDERVLVQNIEDKSEVPVLCDNLIHIYAKEAVLSNFYLKINKGQIYGLLGHNGCGKTTALRIIAGKIMPIHGKILVFGEEPMNKLMKIGYCPQEGLLIGQLTVEQNIRLAGTLKGLRANYVSKYMLRLIIYFRLRGVLQVRARHLSAAQKKKVSLVVALLGFPELLLFDEVTGGVDPEGRRRILNLIKSYSSELGGTVLMVSHDIVQAEDICDRISILKDGVLRKAGTPKSLRAELQHEFSLLTLNFARGKQDIVLERQKAQIKEYVRDLVFVKLELEERLTLAYSLDIRKINIFEIWETAYVRFFLGGIVEKFSLRRHGLPEIVKQSTIGRQSFDSRLWEGPISPQHNLSEKLI